VDLVAGGGSLSPGRPRYGAAITIDEPAARDTWLVSRAAMSREASEGERSTRLLA